MSSSAPNPLSPTPDGAAAEERSSGHTVKRLVAAFLSSFVPGAGQILLGQRREGTALLLAFVALLACVVGFRMLRMFAGFVALWLWLILACYAAYAALLKPVPRTSEKKRSKLWWLAIPPLVYIGLKATFTPSLLLSGLGCVKSMSTAMQPTIYVGDLLMYDKTYYVHQPIARNDLVMVLRNNELTVKRVIAIGGDTIEARDRQIFVNGKLLDEPFIEHIEAPGPYPELDTFEPIAVPEEKYFLMGDNRDISLDSRTAEFGMQDASAIVGRPLYVYWSPKEAQRGRALQ